MAMQVTVEGQDIEVAPDTIAKLRHLALEWRRLADQTRSETARTLMNERADQIEAALRQIDQPSLFGE